MNDIKVVDFAASLIDALHDFLQRPDGRELLEAKKEELRERGILTSKGA